MSSFHCQPWGFHSINVTFKRGATPHLRGKRDRTVTRQMNLHAWRAPHRFGFSTASASATCGRRRRPTHRDTTSEP
eukprot:362705-Chlamydomonas_euryale.AAC.7